MYKKEYKEYTIYRNSWWKFWQVDNLEFKLSAIYTDAYEEVQKNNLDGSTEYSMELCKWVKNDIRELLIDLVLDNQELIIKAKKLSVVFRTTEMGQRFIDGMDFYIGNNGIYFESDDDFKRDNKLKSIGI